METHRQQGRERERENGQGVGLTLLQPPRYRNGRVKATLMRLTASSIRPRCTCGITQPDFITLSPGPRPNSLPLSLSLPALDHNTIMKLQHSGPFNRTGLTHLFNYFQFTFPIRTCFALLMYFLSVLCLCNPPPLWFPGVLPGTTPCLLSAECLATRV